MEVVLVKVLGMIDISSSKLPSKDYQFVVKIN